MYLFQKYHPKTFGEVVGQDKPVKIITRLLNGPGIGGRAFFITGKSGHGKGCLASLIAESIADPEYVETMNSTNPTGAAISAMERGYRTFGGMFGSGKTGRAIIVDEAHGLRKDAIRELLVVLERIPSHVVWIFTTTLDGQQMLFDDYDDASPLISRCIKLQLEQRGVSKPFAQRAFTIAKAEGLTEKPLAAFEKLAKACGNNLRMMLSEVEAGAMLA